jgi:hypothetical protein
VIDKKKYEGDFEMKATTFHGLEDVLVNELLKACPVAALAPKLIVGTQFISTCFSIISHMINWLVVSPRSILKI